MNGHAIGPIVNVPEKKNPLNSTAETTMGSSVTPYGVLSGVTRNVSSIVNAGKITETDGKMREQALPRKRCKKSKCATTEECKTRRKKTISVMDGFLKDILF